MDALRHAFTALWIISASYLGWRAVVAACRIRWARHAYPQVKAPGQEVADEWVDRCRGCLVALGIGDALNLPAESLPRWLTRLRYPGGATMRRGVVRAFRRPGDISDDTQLTIAVARSIDAAGVYSHDRFVDELARWSYFRIGAGRASARAAIHARRHSRAFANRSKGNGAAIRVAPFAMVAVDQHVLAEQVLQNASATHTTDAATTGAVFTALLIHECLRRPPGFLDDRAVLEEALSDISKTSGFPLARHKTHSVPSGHVEECIPAVASVLVEYGSDLRAAMAAIFWAGGDTDSIGAMVGACIGAQIGYRALPAEWRAPLQHHDYIVWLADRLSIPRVPEHGRGEVIEVDGDVARRDVDAIVNAWNRNVIPCWLLLPQGVSKAIRKAGGGLAIQQVGKAGPLPLGNAMETSAGGLDAKWIIHADAINLAWRSSESSIRKATRTSLRLAHWLGARTVALPILGAGSGGYSSQRALEIIEEEAQAMRANFDRIELVRFSAQVRK